MGRGTFIVYAFVVMLIATFINLALSDGGGTSPRSWSTGSSSGGSGWSSGGAHK
jgi:hypothetical protein